MASTSDSSEKSKTDDSIDPLSTKFDPLTALYSKESKVPCVNAPILDNICKFVIDQKTGDIEIVNKKEAKPKERLSTIKMVLPKFETDGWDNVVTRMKTIEGPLAVLRQCKENNLKIKVITRHETGIRGTLTGYIVAFDRLWNIAMKNVTESWIRKKSRKTPPAVGSIKAPSDRRKWMPVPTVEIKSLNKKTELCTRHLEKILMRALIAGT